MVAFGQDLLARFLIMKGYKLIPNLFFVMKTSAYRKNASINEPSYAVFYSDNIEIDQISQPLS